MMFSTERAVFLSVSCNPRSHVLYCGNWSSHMYALVQVSNLCVIVSSQTSKKKRDSVASSTSSEEAKKWYSTGNYNGKVAGTQSSEIGSQ